MFDFHLHLARLASPMETAKALTQAGCGFNNIACEPWEWEDSLKMMESMNGENKMGIRWFFGVHPMVAEKMSDANWTRLEEILAHYPETQVGECGLDKRFAGYEVGGLQEQCLRRLQELARTWGRSLQIHCVGDYQRILQLLTEPGNCAGKSSKPEVDCIQQIVFHRFGGDISIVKSALKLLGTGAIFSLHEDSFRKKSTAAAIREIPPEQIRFETDADDTSWTAERILEQLQRVASRR